MASSNSSVHYKFMFDVEFQLISFEGIEIALDELKKAIAEKENINLEFVDLCLKNSDTKEMYEKACLIQRNSVVLVQRLPLSTPKRMPKINNIDASCALKMKPASSSTEYEHINKEAYAKMTEGERIKLISTHKKYNRIHYNRKSFQNTSTASPYIRCFQCNKYGHHQKQCPLPRRPTLMPINYDNQYQNLASNEPRRFSSGI